jgi:FMN-dependent oxidoreductase (nitrilotriacetate monooxygenase family)
MTKRISLGVFEMMNPSNGMPTWQHPQGRGDDWDSIDYWAGLSRMLDDAGFEFLFFADTYGYPTIEGAVPDEVVAHGIQFPALDPMLIISALARETTSLGFVLTSPTTVERPYATARRFASLDHYTRGRIGWNIVTGSSQTTTDALFGITSTGTHDSRYDIADEFVDVCLELWEGGWEDDAEARDRTRNVYADPEKLHRIEHNGEHFRASGQFVVPPSKQRTPALFQAGTSARGRAFAARNAEAVFIQGQSIAKAAEQVADIRAQAERHGRGRDEIRVISGLTVMLGDTPEHAAARRAEYDAVLTRADAAVMFAGFTGLDLSALDPASLLTEVHSDLGQTLLDRFVRPGAPVPTVGGVLDDFRRKAIRGFQLTGTAEQVADELQEIIEGSDLDGIMLEPTFGGIDSYREFIEQVLPLLRERGIVGEAPAGSTLREHLGSTSPRLAPTHPGARFRHPIANPGAS